MSNRRDIQFTYTPHNKATIIDCAFTVASSDSGGAGVTSLDQGGRISSVFMHTSSTPASGNPNPQSGIIVVNMQDNYNKFLGVKASLLSPESGSSISISGSSVMTVGHVYTITALGTSSQANWVAVGVPSNITAAVGVSFIASVTGGGTGTGTVQAPASAGSGIDHVEVIGLPDDMQSNGAIVAGAGNGMQLILACFSGGALTAPANGTRIRLEFYLNNSAQGV
jgi:hypothetical protein